MTEPWTPDEHLLDAARAGKLKAVNLEGPERSWVVAGLTAMGVTAEQTAVLLGCSLRLVRTIRAEPMTRVSTYAMTVRVELERQMSLARSTEAVLRAEIRETANAAERYRIQRDELVDALATGGVETFRCGHPKVPYNTYRYRDRANCRECDRERKAARRANRPEYSGQPRSKAV